MASAASPGCTEQSSSGTKGAEAETFPQDTDSSAAEMEEEGVLPSYIPDSLASRQVTKPVFTESPNCRKRSLEANATEDVKKSKK